MLKRLLMGFALVGVAITGNAAGAGLASQTSNERGVKIAVAPQNLSQEKKIWDFEVTLDTHTQPLGDDMAKISALIADGKQYAPMGWDGAPPGGHHRKGTLHFKAIVPQPPSVELQIRLSGDTAPRSFRWVPGRAGSGN